MSTTSPHLARPLPAIRSEFPGLRPGEVLLDGAAGTLVPAPVIEAIADALRFSMANTHGTFAASERSTATIAAAREALADLLGGVPEGVVLGPNMTTLTFHFADALSRDWGPGDEVVVTSLDHDANVRPWVLAAERTGATVRFAEFDPETGELAPEVFEALLGPRTRLVAVTAASNAIGTKPDVRAISDLAHAAGALTYVDGVHATSHGPIDVGALGADFYACSTYKLFGPHAGTVIADPALLERLTPAKLVPAPDAGARALRARDAPVRAARRDHRGDRLDRRPGRRWRESPRAGRAGTDRGRGASRHAAAPRAGRAGGHPRGPRARAGPASHLDDLVHARGHMRRLRWRARWRLAASRCGTATTTPTS